MMYNNVIRIVTEFGHPRNVRPPESPDVMLVGAIAGDVVVVIFVLDVVLVTMESLLLLLLL